MKGIETLFKKYFIDTTRIFPQNIPEEDFIQFSNDIKSNLDEYDIDRKYINEECAFAHYRELIVFGYSYEDAKRYTIDGIKCTSIFYKVANNDC